MARILTVGNLYPPRHFGGYERVWSSAVAALRRAGHEVRVLASDASGEGEETDPDVHRDLPWYWREYEFPRQSLRERRRTERGALRALARRGGLRAAVDGVLRRVARAKAQRGDVGLVRVDGREFLVVIEGDLVVAPGPEGLVRQARAALAYAWSLDGEPYGFQRPAAD